MALLERLSKKHAADTLIGGKYLLNIKLFQQNTDYYNAFPWYMLEMNELNLISVEAFEWRPVLRRRCYQQSKKGVLMSVRPAAFLI